MKATITFTEDIDALAECVKLDDQPRSKVEISKTEGELTFTVTADDIAALRAGINGITQMVSVFYQMKNG